MYELNKTYKFELTNRMYYTGVILSEDEKFVKLRSIRNEELILNKDSIVQSKRIEDDKDVSR